MLPVPATPSKLIPPIATLYRTLPLLATEIMVLLATFAGAYQAPLPGKNDAGRPALGIDLQDF